MKLLGKTAVVTGAARGLGRAYALRLAALGADVAIVDVALRNRSLIGNATSPERGCFVASHSGNALRFRDLAMTRPAVRAVLQRPKATNSRRPLVQSKLHDNQSGFEQSGSPAMALHPGFKSLAATF
jgi:NAD(P)-dependent dehydrogenase (short-subunit alcohol dehydrogenase family)